MDSAEGSHLLRESMTRQFLSIRWDASILQDSRCMSNSTPSDRQSPTPVGRIPLWLKLGYTAFMAVLVPVYWYHYGWTNFLYFCDVALFVTLIGLWKESRILLSLAAVGIVLPQILWCVDFGFEMAGGKLTGMTTYMFDASRPLYLRGLSLFHGWLPWLLIFGVARLGYDRRALGGWTVMAAGLCLVAFFLLPPAGASLEDSNLPRNVNYVFGMDDSKPQAWLDPVSYLIVWLSGLIAHVLLSRLFKSAA
jgi:hypothetical protein